MQERENVLRIFKETKEAVLRGDSGKVSNLSNQTTNTAALTQDPDNIAAAVVVYSLGKIIERGNYKEMQGWQEFYKIYLNALDNIIISIEKNDDEGYRKNIKVIRSAIGKLSGRLKTSIEEVFRRASINKASKIYDHGTSMETTANLLGITLYELASYAGEKGMSDAPENKTVGVKTRIKLAMDIFG
ncbi:MAG: hypothetical protein KJ905_03860 [Nanoarchaeota archaeon]|nr:hypothetical protein [Nanoarchaeota archaeon]MBU1501877.1 hypothetical protein [Nanoarchaeota archaeon]MBU2458804.1 hypothetical protein [Nanoarchaeota archaeon]